MIDLVKLMRKGRRKAKRSSEKEVLLSEGFALELDNSLRESNYTANLGESQNHERNEIWAKLQVCKIMGSRGCVVAERNEALA
jgi:hypothetical protein